MMNRKKKKELRQRQSTRQLMGIVKITPHGIQTEAGERVFYLIRPDNLSVLSPEVIRSRIRSLTVLLSTQPALEILALDSRESFQRNKEYYQRRIEEETVPEVRELLEKDLAHAASRLKEGGVMLIVSEQYPNGKNDEALKEACLKYGMNILPNEEVASLMEKAGLKTQTFTNEDKNWVAFVGVRQ